MAEKEFEHLSNDSILRRNADNRVTAIKLNKQCFGFESSIIVALLIYIERLARRNIKLTAYNLLFIVLRSGCRVSKPLKNIGSVVQVTYLPAIIMNDNSLIEKKL